ncbi:hypothetical protein SKAU_G00164300 [Synaphobranchus kaupii]|uniref:DDE-1 domain-containing protein n=1 Tax=Synaphobranchus kaupii TaxID=118154 RepID=A0A9Q1FJ45_SYNKA|nr:hypothetical protein SKAU_G00164300 [Synaphobranchus kaupii]
MKSHQEKRGDTTTALASFNAAGDYGPLLVIFKAKRLKVEWLYNAPPSTVVKVSNNGWITTELFSDWGKQVVDMLPKDDARPHVLLLDGHSSHVYNMEFLKLMQTHKTWLWGRMPLTEAKKRKERPLFPLVTEVLPEKLKDYLLPH